ncbi:MAG: urea ABC transporter ATP-binding protein UrtD [Cyanobacteriota bacterium]
MLTAAPATTRQILQIQDLTVSFDGFKALNGLNFSLDEGELRVVIGPNGAGKTTFLDVLTGKVKPTKGRVLFKGKDLIKLKEYQISNLGIGRKFQTPRVYQNLSSRQNLELSFNPNKGVFSTLLGKRDLTDKIDALLETIGLTHKDRIPAGLLSHGEKQWLEIGMVIAQNPDLLLLDECVAGMTDKETEATGELIQSLAKDHTIVVIEHDMVFVRQIARKVTVLHQGTLLCEGSFEEVKNDPRVIEVYLGSHKAKG